MKIRYVLCVLLCNFVSSFITTIENTVAPRDCMPSKNNKMLSCGCYQKSSDELADVCWGIASHTCPTSPDKDACPTSPPSPTRRTLAVKAALGCPTSPINPIRRSVASFALNDYLKRGTMSR